jgi:hypothetical protein
MDQLPISIRIRNLIASLVLIALTIFIIYPFLHEAGHLIAAFIFGGKNLKMSLAIINAHSYFNGMFSYAQIILIHLSGLMFPYLIWLFTVFAITRKQNPVIQLFRMIYTLVVLCTLLPWIIVPLLYRAGSYTRIDDIVTVIQSSGIDEFFMSGLFALLLGLSLLLTIYKIHHPLKIFYSKII